MLIDQKKAGELLRKYSIPFPETIVFNHPEFDKKINYPVALKVDSPEILHKSDFGAVFTDLKTQGEVNRHIKTLFTLLKMHNIKEYNFIVQEMVEGTELIAGMKRDDTFGTILLVGIGGVFVELVRDVSMRIPPLTKKICNEMIEELKGKKLLEGFRGKSKVNKEAIVDILLKLSKLSLENKDIKEIDFNPIIAGKEKSYVVDARVIKYA